MPKDRFARLVCALVALVSLFAIGRNFYHRRLNNQLIAAVEVADVDAVQSLLNRGADVNSRKPLIEGKGPGAPLLSLAIEFSSMTSKEEQVACLLLQHGADIREQNSPTYLEQACGAGSVQVARCLLDRGANPNYETVNGYTALSRAINYANNEFANMGAPDLRSSKQAAENLRRRAISRDLVQLLRQHGAHLTLPQAVQIGDRAELKAQLEAGVPADQHEKRGETALWLAVKKDDLETATLLVAQGADINFQDGVGRSALEMAAENDRLETARFLLAHGAKVNSVSRYYGTPLEAAVMRGHGDIARLLLARGADIKAHNMQSSASPILTLAIRSMPSLVPELLKRGANINANYGEPLRQALRSRHLDIARELLRHGAKVNPVRPAGNKHALASGLEIPFCPLMVAALAGPEYEDVLRQAGARVDEVDKQTVLPEIIGQYMKEVNRPTAVRETVRVEQIKVIAELLALGAEINSMDSSGRTALTEAVVHAPSVVKALLEHGADPNQTNHRQDTPLYLAVKANSAEVVRLLLAHGVNVNARRLRGHTALYYARRHHYADIAGMLQQAGAKDD